MMKKKSDQTNLINKIKKDKIVDDNLDEFTKLIKDENNNLIDIVKHDKIRDEKKIS